MRLTTTAAAAQQRQSRQQQVGPHSRHLCGRPCCLRRCCRQQGRPAAGVALLGSCAARAASSGRIAAATTKPRTGAGTSRRAGPDPDAPPAGTDVCTSRACLCHLCFLSAALSAYIHRTGLCEGEVLGFHHRVQAPGEGRLNREAGMPVSQPAQAGGRAAVRAGGRRQAARQGGIHTGSQCGGKHWGVPPGSACSCSTKGPLATPDNRSRHSRRYNNRCELLAVALQTSVMATAEYSACVVAPAGHHTALQAFTGPRPALHAAAGTPGAPPGCGAAGAAAAALRPLLLCVLHVVLPGLLGWHQVQVQGAQEGRPA